MIKLLLAVFLILFIVPTVYAAEYGSEEYGCGLYGQGCSAVSGLPGDEDISRGGVPSVQFDIKVSDIKISEPDISPELLFDITFSLEDSTIESSDELIAIVTFEEFGLESYPIELGKYFDFTYFLKGVGSIDNDVTIDFWIEKNGEIITSGSDVIFMGVNEEKTQTARLFLPDNILSGTYKLIIQVGYESFTTESHRTFDLTIKEGEAIVTPRIDLIFIILNESGNEVYKEEDSIIVETEEVLRKSFKGLDLPEGKYSIILQTLYNANVFDEFKQDFEIVREEAPAWGWLIIAVIIIAIGSVIFVLHRARRKKSAERFEENREEVEKKVEEKLEEAAKTKEEGQEQPAEGGEEVEKEETGDEKEQVKEEEKAK